MSAKSRKPLAPPRPIVARVRRFIVDRQVVHPGDRVLAAVSGGADSTCLLLILAALRRSLKIDVHAAYFDHMLRGRRAIEREQRFLHTLCDGLDVPLHTGSADARAYKSKKRLSLEEAARNLRYDFLAGIASENKCVAVATGHTADDQAETVLLHIIRGSGLHGLAAMAPSARLPVRSSNAPRLVRPLLSLSRADTERCCREAGVDPLEDTTNRSRVHLRNRVRHELLPLLRQYNPSIEQALVRLSTAASADIETIEHMALAPLVEAQLMDGALRISRKQLAELPEGFRMHVVRAAIERLLGDTRSFSERNLIAIVRAAVGTTGTALDLPRGLRVEIQRNVVVLSISPRPGSSPKRRVRMPVPGSARFGDWSVRAELLDRPPPRLAPSNGVPTAFLDADALGAEVWLRGRQPGDRYQPLGLGRSKKLQDILVDAHVPRSERNAVPLLCGEGGIAWVAGQPPADWAKITPKTRHTVRIRAERSPA